MISLKLPTSWDQLTPGQIEFYSLKALKNHDPVAVQTLCLIEFSGIKFSQRLLAEDLYEFKKGRATFYVDADRFADMLSRLDFLLELPGLMDPPARIKGCDAPNARLFGVRLDEWFMADNFYSAYTATKEIEYLDQLIAVLYKKHGDQFNNGDDIQQRSRRFSKVPLHIKNWVFLWYTGVKMWVMQKYSYVFEGSGSSDTSPDEVIMGVIRSLNGGNVGNNDKVKASEMHEALFDLNKSIEESKMRR